MTPLSRIKRRVNLHQLLHGYDGGHRLLAGSCELTQSAARRILVQSDLSGSLPPRSFQTYLTGYPVKEMDCYAVARTWYAVEMPRPGCVWTHTLLIPLAEIEALDDIQWLESSFTRPSPDNLGRFRERLSIDTGLDQVRPRPESKDAERFVRAFYQTPSRPVVISATEPIRGECLFLALWGQLWPAARRGLTFSSGSLSARKFDNRPFDLQVTPPAMTRDVLRASGAESVDLDSAPMADGQQDAWRVIATDISDPGGNGFRVFLHSVADTELNRGDIPGVAAIFEEVGQHPRWDHGSFRGLYQSLAARFPLPDQAVGLKRYCLTLAEVSLGGDADQWMLLELASHDYGEAFTSPRLQLSQRTDRLIGGVADSAVAFLNRLLENSLNSFGERIVRDIIANLAPAEVILFLLRHPQYVSTFVKLRPGLATDEQFWRKLRDHSYGILEAIAAGTDYQYESLGRLFAALFASGLDYEASHFVNLFGSPAAEVIFMHRGPTPQVLRDRWLDALVARPDVVRSAIGKMNALCPAVLAGVAAVYDPENAVNEAFPLDLWKEGMFAWANSFHPEIGATVEACAFTFAIALRLHSPLGADLAVLSFENAHAATELQSMPSASWSKLEPAVPSISFFRDWDRCERMRRAFIFSFSKDHWPLDRLLPALRNPKLLCDVIRSALQLSEGVQLLDRLVDGIKCGQIVPTSRQLESMIEVMESRIRIRRG